MSGFRNVLGALIAAMAVMPAAQAIDVNKGATIAQSVCAACHGADGNSVLPANPNLAAQHSEYIAKQLANFKAGERNNAIMASMVAALSPEDMKNVGAYYAKQKTKEHAARDEKLTQEGAKLYRGGNMQNGVPACTGCHGPDGAGMPAQFPRIAGQYSDYTLTQLKAFRAGERANDPAKMMRLVAAKLSDREMQALAEYLSGLR
jgi:cbb3-type cytochrome c oxidase subunit III